MKKIFLICFTLVSVFAQGQWTLFNSFSYYNGELNSVFFTDSNTGYAVGYDYNSWVGRIFKTIDGGATWDTLSCGTTVMLNSVFFTDVNTGYVVGGSHDLMERTPDEQIIIKTTDGGITWEILNGNSNSELNSVYFTNANIGCAFGRNGTIIKTIDGGTTWTDISNGVNCELFSVFFTNADTWYAVGGGDIIIKTIDGGTTWDTLSIGTTLPLKSVYFYDNNTGYVVGGGILKTTDGGTTWISSSIPPYYYWLSSVCFTDASIGYAVGSVNSHLAKKGEGCRGIILKTIDGGTTWTEQPPITDYCFKSVFFFNDTTGYIVGERGIILKTTSGGGLVSIKETQSPTHPKSIFVFTPIPPPIKSA